MRRGAKRSSKKKKKKKDRDRKYVPREKKPFDWRKTPDNEIRPPPNKTNPLLIRVNAVLGCEQDIEDVKSLIRDYLAKKWPFNQFEFTQMLLQMARLSPPAAARKVDMARLYWVAVLNVAGMHFAPSKEQKRVCLAASQRATNEFCSFVHALPQKGEKMQGLEMQQVLPKVLQFIKEYSALKEKERNEEKSTSSPSNINISSLEKELAELNRLADEDEEDLHVSQLSADLKCLGENGELESYTVTHGSGKSNLHRQELTARLRAARDRFASKRRPGHKSFGMT